MGGFLLSNASPPAGPAPAAVRPEVSLLSMTASRQARTFVFLQGPCAPFFAELGRALRAAGARVAKVNFNVGDEAFWPLSGAHAYRGAAEGLPAFYSDFLAGQGATDLVLFGDQRPVHRAAIAAARPAGVRVHVFEEGYFRPYWLTLERGGVNADSRLPRDPDWYREVGARVPRYRNGQAFRSAFAARAWHDVVYHAHGLRNRWSYPGYRGHAPHSAWKEYGAYLRKALSLRGRSRRDAQAIAGLIRDDHPFYLLPLQLNSDTQIRMHSGFCGMGEVIATVMASFARHAPSDARLVVKRHPLDPGLDDHEGETRRRAREFGILDRTVYLDTGHLPTLLGQTAGVVTVNSTVGGSALVHSRPTIALGRSIYGLPGLTFQGGLDRFWQDAEPPDMTLFTRFRNTVIHTTQVNGGFYSKEGIALAVDACVRRLLAERSPLEELL